MACVHQQDLWCPSAQTSSICGPRTCCCWLGTFILFVVLILFSFDWIYWPVLCSLIKLFALLTLFALFALGARRCGTFWVGGDSTLCDNKNLVVYHNCTPTPPHPTPPPLPSPFREPLPPPPGRRADGKMDDPKRFLLHQKPIRLPSLRWRLICNKNTHQSNVQCKQKEGKRKE